MKTKLLIGISIFLIIVNLATLGTYVYYRWTAPPMPPPEYPAHREWMKRREQLRFSPEQRKKLAVLRKDFSDSTRPQIREIMKLRRQVAAMVLDKNTNLDSIEIKIDRISTLEASIEKDAVKMLIEAKEFLSPGQVEMLQRMMMNIMGRRRPGPGVERGEMPDFRDMPNRPLRKPNNYN